MRTKQTKHSAPSTKDHSKTYQLLCPTHRVKAKNLTSLRRHQLPDIERLKTALS
jgi:hypothetical protein